MSNAIGISNIIHYYYYYYHVQQVSVCSSVLTPRKNKL